MEILIASTNKYKIEEIMKILEGKDIQLKSLIDFDDKDEVKENGETFSDNAFIKANHFYQKYKMPVIADDSGLVVNALNGDPGVFSARYSGQGDKENNQKVLKNMINVTDRQAAFVCSLCYIDVNGTAKFFEGRVTGNIAKEERGENGFGYDSIFLIDEHQTLAELPSTEKNKISHRFNAIEKFVASYRVSSMLDTTKEILKSDEVAIERRLMGGMSNYTYVLKSDSNYYTFRIPGEYSSIYVDREIEKVNLDFIKPLNISNETIYLNTENGYKIAKYIPGRPLSEFSEFPYEKVAQLLKKIHQSEIIATNDYNPFGRLTKYENAVLNSGYKHPAEYITLKEEFFQYKDYLQHQNKVFCHGDSQPSNFVLKEDDSLIIVDFEFSGNNDLLYDIACFGNLNIEHGERLLEVYYKDESSNDIKLRFYLWRAFQCFQWYNVACFKEIKGMSKTLHIDFKKVAEKYLEKIHEMMNKIYNIYKIG